MEEPVVLPPQVAAPLGKTPAYSTPPRVSAGRGDIADLVERIDVSTLRVSAPTPIILLCGGKVDVIAPKPTSLRAAYTQIYGRPALKSYATVTPEDFRIFAPDGPYKDWLTFEREFAQIVDLVVLFSESYGSVAELGAFSVVDEIASRLLVVIDDKNYGESSFIKLGPPVSARELRTFDGMRRQSGRLEISGNREGR